MQTTTITLTIREHSGEAANALINHIGKAAAIIDLYHPDAAVVIHIEKKGTDA